MLSLASHLFGQTSPPSWVTEGPSIREDPAAFSIPYSELGTKIYVVVEIGGQPRKLVFDTGSPSMIDSTIVDETGMSLVGKSSGIDAHGAVIESKISQGNLKIGDMEINKLPMFVADFSASHATQSLIGDGVLGSDILPLGAWQIDPTSRTIRFAAKASDLPHVSKSHRVQLHHFGYPYTPILDVHFSENARSKAMLDTGSPTYFSISPADFQGAKASKAIGRTISGFGSPGASLGGQATAQNLLMLELSSFSIADLDLGRVEAIRREISPSLIGARILDNYVITLDINNGDAFFYKFSNAPFSHSTFGFTLSFDESVNVAAVWDDSPAQQAGLRAGDKLTSLNGEACITTSDSIKRFIKMMGEDKIRVSWQGQSTTLDEKLNLLSN